MRIQNSRKLPGHPCTYLIDSARPALRTTRLDPSWWARYFQADVIDPATGEVLAERPR